MHLRKVLTVGAAVLAAGLLTLSSAATASNPTGTTINTVTVNGATSGTAAFAGVFKSGTASFGGGTFGCTGGSVGGTAAAGATPGTKIEAVAYTSLNITCATPLGVNAVINLSSTTCATGTFQDNNVHNGLVDTGTGSKFSNVDGAVSLATNCGVVTAGPCTANVQGSVPVAYNEALKSVGGVNFQDLILNGGTLSLSNQSFFCFGLLTGTVTLNAIDFNINAAAGGIDFRTS